MLSQARMQSAVSFGAHILTRIRNAEQDLRRSGKEGAIGLIAACIKNGNDTENAIAAATEGLLTSNELRHFLAVGAGHTRKRRLWDVDETGRYTLRDRVALLDDFDEFF